MQFVKLVCGYVLRADRGRLWLLGVAALPLLLCRSTLAQAPQEDPWEVINRPLYAFNEKFDDYLVKPVTLSYDYVMPRFAKRGVRNFLNNLDDVNVIANDLLQLKMRNALDDSCRFLLNTTAGMGGLFDVASGLGLYKNYEDFGQTLGHWGVDDGGYLVLPFLGASTVRDTIGYVSDLLLNPVYWVTDSTTRSALYIADTVDTRLSYIAAESMITGDEYEFVRNAYLQRREYLVNDGAMYDEFDEY